MPTSIATRVHSPTTVPSTCPQSDVPCPRVELIYMQFGQSRQKNSHQRISSASDVRASFSTSDPIPTDPSPATSGVIIDLYQRMQQAQPVQNEWRENKREMGSPPPFRICTVYNLGANVPHSPSTYTLAHTMYQGQSGRGPDGMCSNNRGNNLPANNTASFFLHSPLLLLHRVPWRGHA